MKKFAKKIVVSILAGQVRRLRAKNKFKVIVVGGSIGKTSTKMSLATVLGQQYRVRFQDGNYNDLVSVPLVFFGLTMPGLTNPFAWLRTFWRIEADLHKPHQFDYVVLELGTDGPGQIEQFKQYSHADLGVLTAIAPEHMEFFADLDAVAKEELTIASLCDRLVVNKDLCAETYLRQLPSVPVTYSTRAVADYQMANLTYREDGYEFDVLKQAKLLLHGTHEAIAETQLYSICAAVAIADLCGMEPDIIDRGIHAIHPVSGRMQSLRGIHNSLILDDTYNASPIASKAALDTLYKRQAPQKIAILGNMNELGAYSEPAHKEVGEHCDRRELDLVVTIGNDANRYLATAAEKKGCKIKTFTSPYEAGEYLKQIVKPGALILAKGSQNGVFAEEAVKLLLADPMDASKLVRQSASWLAKKKKAFVR